MYKIQYNNNSSNNRNKILLYEYLLKYVGWFDILASLNGSSTSGYMNTMVVAVKVLMVGLSWLLWFGLR